MGSRYSLHRDWYSADQMIRTRLVTEDNINCSYGTIMVHSLCLQTPGTTSLFVSASTTEAVTQRALFVFQNSHCKRTHRRLLDFQAQHGSRTESILGQVRSQTASLRRSFGSDLESVRVFLFVRRWSVQKAIKLEPGQKEKRVRRASVNRDWCQCQLFLSPVSTFCLHY